MPQLLIREATVDDVPAITEIFNDSILHTAAVYHYQPVTEASRLDWFQAKRADGWPIFVAHDAAAAQIVGYSTYGPFRPSPAYLHSAELSIHVHPARRGQGIGKRLIPPLIASAKARNIHTLLAGIDSSNAASIGLHQHFGFVEVAHFKQVGYKFDRWLDLLFMQLLLKADGGGVSNTKALIAQAYSAFNRRDIDSALALMTDTVNWPKASEGGRVIGKEEIRAYWTRQWSEFNPNVEPLEVTDHPSGRTEVKVHQLVKTLNDEIISDQTVLHVFGIANGLIERMDIAESEPAFGANPADDRS